MSDLPTGWADAPIDALGEIVGGGTPSRAAASFWGGSIPWVTPTDITALTGKYVWDTPEKITDDGLVGSAARLLPRGAIVVTTRATLGEAAIAAVPLTTNQGFKNIIPNEATDAVFTYYLLKTLRPAMLRLASGTTFPEISKKDFSKIRIQRPIRTEQERIGALLDTAGEAIAKTEAVIAKLRQVRTGLIHDLLTCGLDENGHLRDPIAHPEQFHETSLVLLPKAWDVVALGTALSMQAGSGLTGEDITEAGPYPAYGGNGQRGFTSRFTHEGRFVLIGRQGALCGNIAVASGQFFATEHAIVCTPVRPVSAGWLACYLERMNLNRFSEASAQPGLSVQKISYKQIALPPLDEQVLIETRIDELDRLLEAETAELAKLQFIKSGLMDDLLTGRVRVPETR